ncbi:hypothetical protein M8523_15310 [Hyphomicrobiales bacterium BP6-180914]|uniref:Uncharacterized protein n=1 Tax=Lichenifustis flavocetrariae TaxID=2949735 RepID=A0AA41YY08_9HYPH|nr:hypothetical protein [Lichenifustis flavocetrariae]MCW6509390.1 hypothetical protein [Lichenifustis flavocetrariae]
MNIALVDPIGVSYKKPMRDAGRGGGLHVAYPVAHHAGSGEIEPEFMGRCRYHSRRRLAPVMRFAAIAQNGGIRVIRTGEYEIDVAAEGLDRFIDQNLNGREGRPVKQPTTDPGLVGNDTDRDAAGVRGGDKRQGFRNQHHVFWPMRVTAILDQHAVAIEEKAGLSPALFGDCPIIGPAAVVGDHDGLGAKRCRKRSTSAKARTMW